METNAQLLRNITEIRERVADAARRVGRSPDEVRLVAVSKYLPHGHPIHQALVVAGCHDLGEARPQQLADKASTWSGPPVAWHLIGPLQRNKIRRVLPHVAIIHSADSARMLGAIERIAGELALRPQVLLECNISGDETKVGFHPDELPDLIPRWGHWQHVQIRGLMGMSGLTADSDATRRQFASLRALRDRLAPMAPESIRLEHLSMGMSDDYETAIEEGATIVRVGSALFEGVDLSRCQTW